MTEAMVSEICTAAVIVATIVATYSFIAFIFWIIYKD